MSTTIEDIRKILVEGSGKDPRQTINRIAAACAEEPKKSGQKEGSAATSSKKSGTRRFGREK